MAEDQYNGGFHSGLQYALARTLMLKKFVKLFLKIAKMPILFIGSGIGLLKQCNYCNWRGRDFYKFSMPEKPTTIDTCPRCWSAPRHRLALYLLKGKLGTGHTTLQVAPLKITEKWLRSISTDYLSIDLSDNKPAMRKMDLTALDIEDSSFSLIWAAHVLEHIPDDRKAMVEMFRILKPGGLAIILVPIGGDTTYEDASIQTDQERLKHYLQADHVRFYGLDIANRLRDVGFSVEVMDITQVPTRDVKRYGMDYPITKEIFVCRKS